MENLTGFCARGVLQSPTMWLGIFLGGYVFPFVFQIFSRLTSIYVVSILTVLLMLYRIRGALLIGIFLTSIVSWPRPTSVTYFPYTTTGDAMFEYFKQVVTFHSITKVGNVIDVSIHVRLALHLLTHVLAKSITMGTFHRVIVSQTHLPKP